MFQKAWWNGSRGEWYVVGQVALIGLVFFGPRTAQGLPAWVSPLARIVSVAGGIILGLGLALLFAGIFKLGANLTALPYPQEQGTLIETGPYRLVRHPMYSGGMLIALGYAFLVHGWLTLIYVILLFVFFDVKSRREEKWLEKKFSGYSAYQKCVRKLIPLVY